MPEFVPDISAGLAAGNHFLKGYLEACEFTDQEQWGDKVTGFSDQFIEIAETDCATFYGTHSHMWANEPDYNDERAGNDFWYSRNGHGTGFWDRDLQHKDKLHRESKQFGSVDSYVGDDGKVY